MAPRQFLVFGLIACLGILACSKPNSLQQVSTKSSFEFSRESPFHWNLKKSDVASPAFSTMSNSQNIKAMFAHFGEVQYQLYFDWKDDTLSLVRITLAESTSISHIVNTLYDTYIYLFNKNISFENTYHKLSKTEFSSIVQKQVKLANSSKSVYFSIKSTMRNHFFIYISDSTENAEPRYQAVLQISRS